MQIELLEWMQKEFEKKPESLKRIDIPTLFEYDEEMYGLILSLPRPKRFPFLLFLVPSEEEYDKCYPDEYEDEYRDGYETMWGDYLIANKECWYRDKEKFLKIAEIIKVDEAK